LLAEREACCSYKVYQNRTERRRPCIFW
jgi:hypothetical protein